MKKSARLYFGVEIYLEKKPLVAKCNVYESEMISQAEDCTVNGCYKSCKRAVFL